MRGTAAEHRTGCKHWMQGPSIGCRDQALDAGIHNGTLWLEPFSAACLGGAILAMCCHGHRQCRRRRVGAASRVAAGSMRGARGRNRVAQSVLTRLPPTLAHLCEAAAQKKPPMGQQFAQAQDVLAARVDGGSQRAEFGRKEAWKSVRGGGGEMAVSTRLQALALD